MVCISCMFMINAMLYTYAYLLQWDVLLSNFLRVIIDSSDFLFIFFLVQLERNEYLRTVYPFKLNKKAYYTITHGHYTNFWPLLIWTLLPNLTFYLVVQGFHRTYATGAACQQRTLTPPDTWSCPTLGLACVLMSRPISPELVLSPDVWILNTPRYFSFAFSSCVSDLSHFEVHNIFCAEIRTSEFDMLPN